MVQLRISAGDYNYHGYEKTESGYHYDSVVKLSLITGGSLVGTVTFTSSREDSEESPIFGTWHEDGRVNYCLNYGSMQFYYNGFIHDNISAGKFYQSDDPSATYDTVGTNVRGKYRHIRDGTQDNPEILKSVSELSIPQIATEAPPPSEDPKFTNIIQEMNEKTINNYVRADVYSLVGKETCESTYVYDATIRMELNYNGTLTGHVTFASSSENSATNAIEGKWKSNGQYYYTLSYAGLCFAYEGVLNNGTTVGRFWKLEDNNTTYADAATNLKGVFSHSTNPAATPNLVPYAKAWSSTWFDY